MPNKIPFKAGFAYALPIKDKIMKDIVRIEKITLLEKLSLERTICREKSRETEKSRCSEIGVKSLFTAPKKTENSSLSEKTLANSRNKAYGNAKKTAYMTKVNGKIILVCTEEKSAGFLGSNADIAKKSLKSPPATIPRR
jgi:hypothetical protein